MKKFNLISRNSGNVIDTVTAKNYNDAFVKFEDRGHYVYEYIIEETKETEAFDKKMSKLIQYRYKNISDDFINLTN